MDKNVLGFIDEYKLDCVTDKLVYGSIMNYQVAFRMVGSSELLFFVFTKIDNDLSQKLNNFFVINQYGLKYFLPKIYHYGFSFVVSASNKKKCFNYLRNIINILMNFLKENNALDDSFCPICGMKMEEKEFVILDGLKFYVDSDCSKLINEKMEKKEEANEIIKDFKYRGLLGAFLGGLLGFLIWLLVGGVLSYISGWMAFVVCLLSTLGFSLMNKVNSKFKIISVSLSTIIFSFVGLFVTYIILASKMNLNFFDIIFTDNSLMAVFVGDLVLFIIALIFSIFYIIRKSRIEE